MNQKIVDMFMSPDLEMKSLAATLMLTEYPFEDVACFLQQALPGGYTFDWVMEKNELPPSAVQIRKGHDWILSYAPFVKDPNKLLNIMRDASRKN